MTVIVALALLLSLAFAATATASVTIGETFTPVNGCLNDATFLQIASPGSKFEAPYAGTITSFSYQAPAGGVNKLKFKVARRAGGNDFTIVGDNGVVVDPVAGMLNTYPAQIPVKPGDLIGFYWDTGNTGMCSNASPPSGFILTSLSGDQTGTGTYVSEPGELDVSAQLDPTNTFTLGALTRNKKKGTATLAFNLPNPGDLSGSGQGAQVASTGAVASKAVPAGTATLVVKAKGKKKRKLNEKGKVKLNLAVTYTPTGGAPSTQSVKVKLKKRL
jgi:hypothetical protein